MMLFDLAIGAVRFLVTFEDKGLTVPIVKTIKFEQVRRNYCGQNLLIFREVYFEGEGEAIFVRESDAESLVLDQERLISVLRRSFDGSLSSWPPV